MTGARLRKWWDALVKPRPVPPTPEPDQLPTIPIPAKGKISVLALLWRLWRQRVDLEKLWPALISIPVILFFAISGMLAWVALLLGFFWKLVQQVVALCC